MTQKAVVKLVKEVDEKVYSFEMPIGAPFGQSYDVLFEMLQEVIEMSKTAAEKAKREEAKGDGEESE